MDRLEANSSRMTFRERRDRQRARTTQEPIATLRCPSRPVCRRKMSSSGSSHSLETIPQQTYPLELKYAPSWRRIGTPENMGSSLDQIESQKISKTLFVYDMSDTIMSHLALVNGKIEKHRKIIMGPFFVGRGRPCRSAETRLMFLS